MTKNVLFISALILSGMANSQVTITEANVAGPTDLVTQSNDTLPTVASPTGGADQIWDYSTGLVAHEENSMTFSSPGWLNNAASFPTSNLAAVDQTGFEIYFINDASSMRMVGVAGDFFGSGTDNIVLTNPAEEILRFPANYNDAHTTSSIQRFSFLGSDVGAPVDSIVSKTYRTTDVLIDAWGSMTTPYGTFEVLRVSETAVITDSAWAYTFGFESLVQNGENTEYTYAFWSDDPTTRFPVMEMRHDNAGNVLNVEWLQSEPSVELNALTLENVIVYPNPTSDQLTIEFNNDDVSSLEVLSINGTLMFSSLITSKKETIDVSKLEKGTYFYKLLNDKHDIISTNKFIVD